MIDASDLGSLDEEARTAFGALPVPSFEHARRLVAQSERLQETEAAIELGLVAARTCLLRHLGVPARDLPDLPTGMSEPVAFLLGELESALVQWPQPSEGAALVAHSIVHGGRKDLSFKLGLVIAELMLLRAGAAATLAEAQR